MNTEEVFLRKLDDLHRSINSYDIYEILRAAAILRMLCLDNLIVEVNRNYRQEVVFKVAERISYPDNLKPDIMWHDIDPHTAREGKTRKDKKLGAFRSTIVASVNGYDHTVTDFIKFVANVMGGVHVGEPKEKKEEALAELQGMYFSNMNAILKSIISIGRIVLEGLKELHYEVSKLARFENIHGWSFFQLSTLYPTEQGRENYILDAGVDENTNRISLYIDMKGILCLLYIDHNGSKFLIETAKYNYAYNFNALAFIEFDIAVINGELLMGVNAGDWYYYSVFQNISQDLSEDLQHYVIGSNVTGTAMTNMLIKAGVMYKRILTRDEKSKLRCHILNDSGKGERFRGNKYMVSKGHPNFENKSVRIIPYKTPDF